MRKNKILTITLTEEAKRIISQAADLHPESVASFMRRTALAEANRILRETNDSASLYGADGFRR